MVEVDRIYEKLDYPVISQEEGEELTQALTSLADSDSSDEAILANDSGDDSGSNELNTIYYINFNSNTDQESAEMKAQLEAVRFNVNLSSAFMSAKASDLVKSQITSDRLPSGDEPRKAAYKAQVVNFLFQKSPWIDDIDIRTLRKEFTAEKNTFHNQLVTKFTEGLNLPGSITQQVEGILTNIKNTINVASVKEGSGLKFFILLTIYHKNDLTREWLPRIRTINFRVSQSLSSYTKSKGDNSSGINVNVDIEYEQTDSYFNDKLFKSNAKASIQQLLSGIAVDSITKPTEIPL